MSFYEFMPTLLNMSLTASVAIVLVILLRLLLKKTPKVISYALWGVVLFRLLCPVSIGSSFSLYNLFDAPTEESGAVTSVIEYVPSNIVHTEYPSVALPVPGISDAINEALPQGQEQLVADPIEAPMSIATYVWMIGVLGMVIYSIVSYVRLRRTLSVVVPLRDNIFIADDIKSPFVVGLFRPKIYLPCNLGDKEQEYIILHEQHHIKRLDHVMKALAFLALAIHWFNPLVWVAFVLASKDMEMSCDEAVIRKVDGDVRADYSASLLTLATGRRIIAGTPLAFGEGDTKGRINNLSKWKKPAVWVVLLAVVACVILAISLLTNPSAKREFPINGSNVSELNTEQVVGMIARAEKLDDGSQLCVNENAFDLMFTSDFEWANDGAIQFFYLKDQKTYSAQLRMFHGDNKYFITDSSEWIEQEQFFKLFHYLDALKYMPQEEIRKLSPDADGFSVYMRNDGVPGDYDRVLKYSQNGVEDIDGWYIHLEAQPLHEVEGGAYNGSGDEVIHLFYGHQDLVMLESDSLTCYTESEGTNSYIEPEHFANGFDWDYEHLAWGEMQSSGKLIFTANWDTDELVVSENYYEKTSPDSTMIHQETYILAQNADGKFELKVDYKNPGTEEMAVYFIQDESGNGKYVMKILFGKTNDNSSAGTYISQDDAKFYLTIGAEGVKSIELSTPHSSGGCQNADGSPYKMGESIWLEPLDGVADLRGLEISALDAAGEIIWSASIPDGDENRGFTHLTQDGWTLALREKTFTEIGRGSAAEQIKPGTQKFTDENLIKKISKDLNLPADCSLSYVGEYSDGSDTLLWFAIDGNYPDRYVAVECEKQSSGKFKFIDSFSPMIYAVDIVHVVWKAEDIFLVNNRDCAKIVYMNQAEEVVKTTDLTEQGLPYIFRLSMPTNPGICMFVDANGEEIR